MGDHSTGPLTQAHIDYLTSHAIDIETASSLGVRSLLSRDDTQDMGGHWVNFANFPALAFPWTSESGRTEYQVRPDNPTKDAKGRPRKYVFNRDMTPVLWAVRPVPGASKILIVEGTKQSLAAASHAPLGVGVYGIAGCRMWQRNGNPIQDLEVVEGREVVVILDADCASNPQVYDAGIELEKVLSLEGATKVLFSRLPGDGTNGLDDVLASRSAASRPRFLTRLIAGAKPKPADSRPKVERKRQEVGKGSDRTKVIINQDRFQVINELTQALLDRWNAKTLFCHGGVISRRKADGMHPVDKGSFNDLVQETAMTVSQNEGANGVTETFGWPDPGTMMAVSSRADRFARLDRTSHAPFVRDDGTVVTEPGYDEATRTMLIPDEAFTGIDVPDSPSPEQIRAARELILNDWLGDFPLETETDKANLMGLIVTPAIRGMCPKVPLAVIDGLQMGVGKNLLADQILTVYTGSAAEPMNWVSEPEELRKQITSAFRAGSEFFVFDEAHTIEGAPLAQALTASTWQDRILGVSTMANFPNKVTWISLGNQVHVRGDLTRRVYRIALRPRYANPQDRDASTFRHPGQSGMDLGSWTRKNRRELMTAILTLVRAWFAAGSPRPARGVSFGSFETWEKIVGGIVETAGMTGFLDNIKAWRSESDFDTQYWAGHLRWLRDTFGSDTFRTAEVRSAAMSDPAGYLAPPKLDDPADRAYGKALGEAYSRLRGRRYDKLWVERDGHARGNVSLWRVNDDSDLPPVPGPQPQPKPEPSPKRTDEPGPASPDTDVSTKAADVMTFDLETGDASDLYKTPGQEFVRIGATAADNGAVIPFTGPTGQGVAERVVSRLHGAAVVTGHNIMAFDFPALVRAGAITFPEVHRMAAEGRLFDALLVARYIDPPMARNTGVDRQRRYDLGTLARTYGLGSKLTEVSKPLEKKYGGWASIPIDTQDPDLDRAADAARFIQYMKEDVSLSRSLYQALMDKLGGTVPDYLVREHRVAALGAQIAHNGFLVDQPLLAERVAEVDKRKAASLAWLNRNIGLPLVNSSGKEHKSPLATLAGRAALETALRDHGVTSLWRTKESQALDTSGDHMRHLAMEYHHIPAVRAIARHVYRIVSSRSVYQTLQDNLCPDGRVHPKIGFEQATGRWSVTSPGLTVLGKRGGRHVERAVLLPDPGEVLIAADLSQVDMRAVAGLSQDQAYIKMLKSDDPHKELAIALFGDASFRERAKAIGHGWNYGESLKRISLENDIEPSVVVQFDQSMRERFPRVVQWRDEVRAIGESGTLLDNGFGRKMRPEPQRSHTQAPALMGQGGARDIMMEGLLRMDARLLPMLRAQIHDEVVLSVPENEVQEISRAVVEAMTFEWRGVPIMADVSKAGTDWSLCYSK